MFEILWYLMLILYIPACVGLCVIVLLQKGKGVGFAGAFGVGTGTDAVFGPRGARTLPQKLTYIMAGTFMFLALCMSLISGRLGKGAAPETITDQPAAQTQTQSDTEVLNDLGSGLKDGAAAAAPSTDKPADKPVEGAPATPAPAPAAPATPAPAAPAAPAPEAPATPAPAAPSGS